MRLDSKSEAIFCNVYPEVAIRSKRAIDNFFKRTGLELRVTEGLRTYKKQLELYNQTNKVTDALPGLSFHNYGMAVDCCFAGDDPYLSKRSDQAQKWQIFGRCVEDAGLRWGGRFKIIDQPHVEISASLSVREMKQLLEKGGIRSVWQAVDWLLCKSGDEWMSPNSTYRPLDPRAIQGG